MRFTTNQLGRLAPLMPLALLVAACGAPAAGKGGEGNTGQTSLAITSVPAGVQCIQVTAAGSSTVNQQFSVTAGQTSVGLSLGELPLGSVAISGQAYGAACAAIAGTSPTYIADAQTITVQTGVVDSLTMTFRLDNPVSATANFVGDVTAVAVSPWANFFVMSDGTVHASGDTILTNTTTVAPMPNPSGVSQIAGGYGFWCALLTSGQVQCWGLNSTGQLGNGSTSSGYVGLVTLPLSGVVQITAGYDFACAVESNGEAFCWGDNTGGELGNGNTTSQYSPVLIGYGFSKLAAGYDSTCGLTNSGYVECWGNNSFDQLGNGSTTSTSYPAIVAGVDATIGLAVGGYHTCALRADGTVRCWGYGAQGALGNGTMTSSGTPVLASVSGVTQLAASFFSTCARNSAGVYCWGEDTNGELGDATGTNSASPVFVSTLSGNQVTQLHGDSSAYGFCAQLANQTVDCWGQNAAGQLGSGNDVSAFVPTPVAIQ